MGSWKAKKTARDIYMRTLDIEFELDQSISSGSTLGDSHTDRNTHTYTHTHRHTHTHTHRHTHTQKHIFLKHCRSKVRIIKL